VSVFIANESPVDADETGLVALARHVLDALQLPPLVELSVLLVDLTTMEDLNTQFAGVNAPTDVLAFEQDDAIAAGTPDEDDVPETLLGDVVICPEYAREGATRAGHPLAAELELLLTHGILHLCGYDHGEPDAEDTREMFGRQHQLLASWALARGPAR